MIREPIICSSNDFNEVLDGLRKRDLHPWATDVIGNANYRVSYFQRIPKQPQDASSGTSESRRDPATPVKGAQVAGHITQRSVAAGGETRAEKPKSVTDAPASNFGSVAQMAAHPSKRLAKAGLSNWKDAGSSPVTATDPSAVKPAQGASCSTAASVDGPDSVSIEDRLAALQSRLAASGKLRRSKPQTQTEHARKPYKDD